MNDKIIELKEKIIFEQSESNNYTEVELEERKKVFLDRIKESEKEIIDKDSGLFIMIYGKETDNKGTLECFSSLGGFGKIKHQFILTKSIKDILIPKLFKSILEGIEK